MRRILLLLLLAWPLGATGCAIVPQNRRAAFADPIMRIGDEPTEAYRKQKFYGVREGAAGGDGASAGGGCGCQ